MESTIVHLVRVSKEAGRALNDENVRRQVEQIVGSVNTNGRAARGWTVRIVQKDGSELPAKFRVYHHDPVSRYDVYHSMLAVQCTQADKRNANSIATEFANILEVIHSRGQGTKWNVTRVDGNLWVGEKAKTASANSEVIGYAPIIIPEEWDENFSHLFGLQPHINRVKRALDAAVISDWNHRFHCALIGPPGCGKSDIARSVKAALGDEAVLEFDATSTTMAGAQKELNERDEMPRVLLVEEIEKAPDTSLAWLLSILDLRGEIRKTTARGNIMRDAKMLAIATVNDLPTFEKANYGALQSRFANKIFFQRPSRDTLALILQREIDKVDGRMEWIAPALDIAEAVGTTDPREVISLCLCGRDGLLDGSFQKDYDFTRIAGK